MLGPSPRRAEESAGDAFGKRRARRQRGFKRLQRGADVGAERFEPRLRARLAGVEHALAHGTSALPLGDARLRVTIAHATCVRANVRSETYASFFLPSFGPGKIPAEAFFCHCFRKRCRRGGCWGCDVRPR